MPSTCVASCKRSRQRLMKRYTAFKKDAAKRAARQNLVIANERARQMRSKKK